MLFAGIENSKTMLCRFHLKEHLKWKTARTRQSVMTRHWESWEVEECSDEVEQEFEIMDVDYAEGTYFIVNFKFT